MFRANTERGGGAGDGPTRDDQETERVGLRESRTREPDDLEPPVRGTASQSGRAVNGTGCVRLCSGTTRPPRRRMSDDELSAGCERAPLRGVDVEAVRLCLPAREDVW